ncbi:MAG: lipoyl(octanoyl) transferase LipB [Alphaproteobacteria bacterium]|nr:lipoyl(octanoyl) transferase LipB [Alphaproteobacteria bacterium]
MEMLATTIPIDYDHAVKIMEGRVAAIRAGTADELVWLLEHPPLYTAGTSAQEADLLEARFPVYKTGRGGQYTYHGPGQRVGYVMLDLKTRQEAPDIKDYIWRLEEWIIRSLAAFDIVGERREGRVGIWVARGNGREDKVAAIGVRIRHGVSYHGIAINVDPDLSHFTGIVPCGISAHGVTSMRELLERRVEMDELDQVLTRVFSDVFEGLPQRSKIVVSA